MTPIAIWSNKRSLRRDSAVALGRYVSLRAANNWPGAPAQSYGSRSICWRAFDEAVQSAFYGTMLSWLCPRIGWFSYCLIWAFTSVWCNTSWGLYGLADNYRNMINNEVFWKALTIRLLYFVQCSFQFGDSMLLSVLVFRFRRTQALFCRVIPSISCISCSLVVSVVIYHLPMTAITSSLFGIVPYWLADLIWRSLIW